MNTTLIFKILFLVLMASSSLWASSSLAEWENFKRHYIQDDGRVIDYSNESITHTEAIGYALFFAVAHNDSPAFEKINSWLDANLPKNSYGLYPWKWGADQNGVWKVLDTNNATDGDLWIAYARLKGSQTFNKAELKEQALVHIDAMEKHLLFQKENKVFLLPGKDGFLSEDKIMLNPSYYIPFIFDTIAKTTKHEIWNQLIQQSYEILAQRYSRFQIHPDWIEYSLSKQSFGLNAQKSLFSYDAIRVPLFWSIWYALHPNQPLKEYLQGYSNIANLSFFPLWINLSENSMSIFPDTSRSMASSIDFFSIIFTDLKRPTQKVLNEANHTYFGNSLTLFSLIPINAYCYYDKPI